MKNNLRNSKKTPATSPAPKPTNPSQPDEASTVKPIEPYGDWKQKEEIIEEFGVDVRTLYNWRKKGLIPFGTMGGKIYYDRKAIELMLKSGGRRAA